MIIREVIYFKGEKLTDHRPRQQPSAQSEMEPTCQKWSRKPEREQREVGPCPSGLVSQRLLAEGVEGVPTTLLYSSKTVFFFFSEFSNTVCPSVC